MDGIDWNESSCRRYNQTQPKVPLCIPDCFESPNGKCSDGAPKPPEEKKEADTAAPPTECEGFTIEETDPKSPRATQQRSTADIKSTRTTKSGELDKAPGTAEETKPAETKSPRQSIQQEPVVYEVLPRRAPFNLKAECNKKAKYYSLEPEKEDCTFCAAKNAEMKNNLCSGKSEPRPLKTSLRTEEGTKPTPSKPTYTNCVWVDDETAVGRVFPMKFRVRRVKNKCIDCGKKLYLRDAVTDNCNLVLLSNCCDIEVYNHKKLENMHLVPVTTIKGPSRFSRKVIDQPSLFKLN